MNAKLVPTILGSGWAILLTAAVSGACYQLTNLGSGCSFDTVVSPNCVLSVATNITVRGTTNSGTGTGSTHATCSSVTYCDQQIGTLDSNGKCVATPPPSGWNSTTTGVSCVLDGTECKMTIVTP